MPKPRNILQRLLAQLKQGTQVFQYTERAVGLVWATSRFLTFILAILTVVGGLLPAAIAYVGKLIVDGVVLAHQSGLERDRLITLAILRTVFSSWQ
jgi:hypothetical protein